MKSNLKGSFGLIRIPLRWDGVKEGVKTTGMPGGDIRPTAVKLWAKPSGGIMHVNANAIRTKNVEALFMANLIAVQI
jgi:hypothetical protein